MRSPINIIVENRTDVQIARALIGTAYRTKFRFWASQGRSSVATIARNIIVHEGEPILIVMDTNTLDARLIRQIQEETVAAAGGVGLSSMDPRQRAAMASVYAFVPEIAVIFFEAPVVLEKLIGAPLSSETIREGRFTPKNTIDRLIEGRLAYTDLLDKLPVERDEIVKGPQARGLLERIDFLIKHHEQFEEEYSGSSAV